MFELFALTGGRDVKTLGVSTHVIFHAITHVLVFRGSGNTEPNILFYSFCCLHFSMAPVFILFLHKCLYLCAITHTLVTMHKCSCLAPLCSEVVGSQNQIFFLYSSSCLHFGMTPVFILLGTSTHVQAHVLVPSLPHCVQRWWRH